MNNKQIIKNEYIINKYIKQINKQYIYIYIYIYKCRDIRLHMLVGSRRGTITSNHLPSIVLELDHARRSWLTVKCFM